MYAGNGTNAGAAALLESASMLYVMTEGGERTIVARSWHSDPRGKCGLCPLAQCSARGRLCHISYPGRIPEESAAFHAIAQPAAGRVDGLPSLHISR